LQNRPWRRCKNSSNNLKDLSTRLPAAKIILINL
jgi:hypothetical protein